MLLQNLILWYSGHSFIFCKSFAALYQITFLLFYSDKSLIKEDIKKWNFSPLSSTHTNKIYLVSEIIRGGGPLNHTARTFYDFFTKISEPHETQKKLLIFSSQYRSNKTRLWITFAKYFNSQSISGGGGYPDLSGSTTHKLFLRVLSPRSSSR